MQPCRNCGRATDEDVCEHCGTVTRCASCREWLDGPFCGNCGTKASESAVATPPFTGSQPPWFDDEDVTSQGVGGIRPAANPSAKNPPTVTGSGPQNAGPPVEPQHAATTRRLEEERGAVVSGSDQPAGMHHTRPEVGLGEAVSGAVRSARKAFKGTPPSWADTEPLQPRDEALGASFEWAASVMRSNAGGLSLVSLGSLGVVTVAFVMSILVGTIATQTRLASITLLGWFIAVLIILTGLLWAQFAVSRAWSMVARGAPVHFTEAFSPRSFPSVILAAALLLPAVALLAGSGHPFYLMTLEFIAGDDLTATQAIGRVFSETCSSLRRFLHMFVIAAIGWAAIAVVVVASMYSFWAVIGASGTSTIRNALGDSDNTVTQAESTFTMFLGVSVVLVVGLGLVMVIYHLIGLWNAGRTRLLAGRPLGMRC